MVLKCRLFLTSPCGCDHDIRLQVADGVNVVWHYACIPAMPLPTHIKPRHGATITAIQSSGMVALYIPLVH